MGWHTQTGARIVMGLFVALLAGMFWYSVRPSPDQQSTMAVPLQSQRANQEAERTAVQDIGQKSPDTVRIVPLPETSPPPRLVRSGKFTTAQAAEASGKARIYRMPGGTYLLRLEDITFTAATGLRVYLSRQAGMRVVPEGMRGLLDLAALSGNVGSQNYLLPDGTDPEDWQAVVILRSDPRQLWATAALD